jgi:NAD(P)-dependent dehydrogenase (short-subunit alcohol dehydrogenase family)
MPKFIPISAARGSLTFYMDNPLEMGGYGASKAALNSMTRKMHFENEWLVAFPLAPGIVETDLRRS